MASPTQTLTRWQSPPDLSPACFCLALSFLYNSQGLKEATLSSDSRPCMCCSLFCNTSPHHTHTPFTLHLSLSGIFFSLTLGLSLDNSSFGKFSQMFRPRIAHRGYTSTGLCGELWGIKSQGAPKEWGLTHIPFPVATHMAKLQPDEVREKWQVDTSCTARETHLPVFPKSKLVNCLLGDIYFSWLKARTLKLNF